MKKVLFAIMTLSLAACLSFTGCNSDSDDDDDETPIENVGGNQNQGGQEEDDDEEETPAPASAVIWTGNNTLADWDKGSIDLEKELITADTIGLKLTWSATATEGVNLQMQDMNWGSSKKMKIKKPDDAGFNEEIYLWATSTETEFTFDSESLTRLKAYGVQIFGDKVTITKVELIKG